MDFRALSDPIVIVSDKGSHRPSFFKRIKPPLTNISKKALAAGLTVLLLFLVGVGVYLQQKPTQLIPRASADRVDLSLKPESISTSENQEFNVDVYVDSHNLSVSAVQIKINFDSTKLQLISVSPSDYLPVVLQNPQNSAGSTSFVLGNLTEPKKGTGTIATLRFKTITAQHAPTQILFDSANILVAAVETGSENALGDLAGATVNIGDLVGSTPEVSFSLIAPIFAKPVVPGDEIPITLSTRSDKDAANLWGARISFPKDLVEVVKIDKSGSFINSWAEEFFDNTTGEISLTGGVPNPGLKTSGINSLMATIVFKAKASGTANFTFKDTSAIYRNSDNVNILEIKRGTLVQIAGNQVCASPPVCQAGQSLITGDPQNGCPVYSCSGLSSPSPSPSPIPSVSPGSKGDGDNNGRVDLKDLSILLSKWSPSSDISSFFQLDFNNDKRINSFDFASMNNILFQLGVIQRR